MEQDAIERAAELAQPGDLVCCMTGRVHEAIQWLRAFAEQAGRRRRWRRERRRACGRGRRAAETAGAPAEGGA